MTTATPDDQPIQIAGPKKWGRLVVAALAVIVAVGGALVGIGIREGSLASRFEQVEGRLTALERLASSVESLASTTATVVARLDSMDRASATFWSTHWPGLLLRLDRQEVKLDTLLQRRDP